MAIFEPMKWKWFLLAVVIISCDDNTECGVTDYSEEVYLAFFNSSDSTAKKITFDAIVVNYAGGTQIPQYALEESSTYILPLDLSAHSTNYLFTLDLIDYDLTIDYNTQARIENPDCGPIFRVTAITAQSEEFDSVAVKVIELSKNLAPHVEIYF